MSLAAVSIATSVQGFSLGAAPLKAATPQMTRVVDAPVMMPKFMKDLFPDMDKPEGDNPIETLTNFFKGLMPKDEEPAPPAPEDPAPESEDDAPAAE